MSTLRSRVSVLILLGASLSFALAQSSNFTESDQNITVQEETTPTLIDNSTEPGMRSMDTISTQTSTDQTMANQHVGMMMMQMYFYMGPHVVYLFKNLRTDNVGTYILSLVITFIIAVSIEGLNFLRYHLQASAYSKLNTLIDKRDNSVYKLSCQIRFIISLVYLLSIFLSYMLMLIVMTFNGGVFIVTVLGLTTGYFIFGFIRKTKYTRIYNPEGDKCCAEVDG